jgi:hypothetical protein
MGGSDGVFPDEVPVADAVEQQRPTAEYPLDDDYAAPKQGEGEVPLETPASDWQEQQETILIDSEFEERQESDGTS